MKKGQTAKYLKGILCALMCKRACLLKSKLAGGNVSQSEWDEFNFVWANYQMMIKKYLCSENFEFMQSEINETDKDRFSSFYFFVNSYLGLCMDKPEELPVFGVCNNLIPI